MVSDIGMPGMDGYELIRHSRAQADTRTSKMPAISRETDSRWRS
jgi:CheY-like chemotaxis protein